jgi:DNA repair protein RecN (Recombination protein N)
MLKSLSIKNYLLIDSIELTFNAGFSVITGETGAGKSIILGAISLLLGKRADTDVMVDKTAKCIVEATFSIKDTNISKLFSENDLDFELNTVIRREILPEGKSRAFINDTPVNLNILKIISEKLLDLHSQHENLALGLISYRTQIIDIAAGTTEDLKLYQSVFNEFTAISAELESLKKKLLAVLKETDYYKFQAEQIEAAQLGDDNELDYLEEQSSLLENATEIKAALGNALKVLDADELSAESFMREAKSLISKLSSKYKPGVAIAERLDSLIIELRDISEQINIDAEKAETNPLLLEKINNRIDLINKLLLKHQVANIAELKQKLSEYNSYLSNADELEEKIKMLTIRQQNSLEKTKKLATALSNKRQKSFPSIEKEITEILKELGISHAVFVIKNDISEEPAIQGFDNINFLFSANKSIAPQQLEKIASGGEFSRLMLTLKSVIAKAADIPTIIFDEIDTGVSGEIASKMGKIMNTLSTYFQVLSITHLPQVAAMGTTHYKVYKHSDDRRSYTNIKVLNDEERLNEIASMISGEKLSVQAIENAKILLQN